MAFIEMDFASGGGSLNTYATLEVKCAEDIVKGKTVSAIPYALDSDTPTSYIASGTFSNAKTDGTNYTATIKAQSIGKYNISCETASAEYPISDFTNYDVEITSSIGLLTPTLNDGTYTEDSSGNKVTIVKDGKTYIYESDQNVYGNAGYGIGKMFDENSATEYTTKINTSAVFTFTLPNNCKIKRITMQNRSHSTVVAYPKSITIYGVDSNGANELVATVNMTDSNVYGDVTKSLGEWYIILENNNKMFSKYIFNVERNTSFQYLSVAEMRLYDTLS